VSAEVSSATMMTPTHADACNHNNRNESLCHYYFS